MKKFISVKLFLPVVLLVTLSCGLLGNSTKGSGNIEKEERQVSGIEGVRLETIGDVLITQGESESLVIETDDNLLPLIETAVVDGILTIKNSSGEGLSPTNGIKYHVTVKDLRQLEASGAGKIFVSELDVQQLNILVEGAGEVHLTSITGQAVDITLNGAGKVVIEQLSADTLAIIFTGAGRVDINGGYVREQTVEIPRSGTYFATELESEQANIEVKGAGTIKVWVTQKLTVIIDGAGTVFYRGEPEIISTINGAGSVKPYQAPSP